MIVSLCLGKRMLDRIAHRILKRIISILGSAVCWLERIEDESIRQRAFRQALEFSVERSVLKLDLGCGASNRPGFIGIDFLSAADIEWDLRWGLPFKDDSVANIRSDHFFEHLELSDVVHLLRECRRVLVPGGVLDFTIPHFDPYLMPYLHKDLGFLKEKIDDVPADQDNLYATCFDRIAWLLHRSGEHKSFFDKESILSKVKLTGFENVTIREFDPKRDINYRFSSVYVVAIK